MALGNRVFFPAFLALVLSAALFAEAAWWDPSYQYRRQITITDNRPAVPPSDPPWWNTSYAFRQRLNVQSTTSAPNPAWWNSSYMYRQQIGVNNPGGSPLAAGYSANISLNTAKYALEGTASLDFSDIRILYNSSGTWTEIDRINAGQSDLLGSWHFNETDGNIAADESGSGNVLDTSGINRLSNPGFELPLTTGWGTIVGSAVAGTSATVDSTTQEAGLQSMKLIFASGTVAYGRGQSVNVVPGAQYALSGWLKNSLTSSGKYLQCDVYGTGIDSAGIQLFQNADWTFASETVTIPAGTTSVAVRCFADGNPTGTVWVDALRFVPAGSGKIGNGLSFDGNTYANAGNLGAVSDWSVEFWMNTTDVSNYRNPFDANFATTGNNQGPRFEQYAGGSMNVIVGTGISTYDGVTVANSLTPNAWHHVAATRSGNTLTAYFDGVQTATKTVTVWPASFGNVTLGIGYSASTERWFKGGLDEAKIYSRALSPAEVQAHYLAGLRGQSIYRGMALNNTKIWFNTRAAIAAGATDSNYWLYFGAGNPQAQKTAASISAPVSPEPKPSLSGGQQAYSDYADLYGYSVSAPINTTKLILEGKANASFSDVRLLYNSSGTWTELDRVNDGQDELIGSWHFDEGSGTSTQDESGNDNVLALMGGASFAPGGVVGNALQLDGTNGKYATLATPSGNIPAGSGPLTITAWIKPTGTMTGGNYDGVVSWGARGSCEGALLLGITDAGKPSMANWCNDFISTTLPAAALNQWSFIALTMNGQSVTLYINGQSQSGTLAAVPNIQYGPLGIGCTDCPGRNFNGTIDEVRIYNRALSATELQAQYQAGLRGQPVYKGMGLDDTKIWFKTSAGTSIPAGGSDPNYWLYYGAANPQAPMADANNVYPFWDDFSGATPDPSKWAGPSAGSAGNSVTVSGGALNFVAASASPKKTIQTKNGFAGNIAVEFAAKAATPPNAYLGFGLMDSDQADGNGFWPFFANANNFGFWSRQPGTWADHWTSLQGSIGAYATNTYNNYRITRTGANLSFYKDNAQIGSTQILPQIGPTAYLVGPRYWNEPAPDSGNVYYDNFKIRKYNPHEPAVSLNGAEQYYFDQAYLPAGYSVNVSFDHKSRVDAGKSLADGLDVRVVYDNGATATEIDRVNETAFNTASPQTQLWFALQAPISPAASDANYWLYYGKTTAINPPQNGSRVYAFYDDFSGSSLDPKWTIDSGSAGLSVASGMLSLSKTTATGAGAWAKFNANGWPYLVEKKSRVTQASGNGMRDRFYVTNQQASVGGESSISFYGPYYFDYGLFQGGSSINPFWGTLQSPTESLSTWYTGKFYGNATDLRWDEPSSPAASNSRKENALALDTISLALTSWATPATYAVDYDYVKVRDYIPSEPTGAVGTEELQCSGDLAPCAGGTGVCCGGACQTTPPSCTGCKTTPYTCAGGVLACGFQPTTYADACGTVPCPIGQTGSPCQIMCDGAGSCGTCTPDCGVPSLQNCSLQVTAFSPSAWSSYAPNQTIAVNYSLLNSTSGRTLQASSTSITLANGTAITAPALAYDAANKIYYAKISPVSATGTPSENITISASAGGCADATKTIAYSVIGPAKPAMTAPDFEPVLLPALGLLALFAMRRKKAGAA